VNAIQTDPASRRATSSLGGSSLRRNSPSTIVPNYTAWLQSQECVSGLPRAVLDSSVGETRTRDLSIKSPTFYHYRRSRKTI